MTAIYISIGIVYEEIGKTVLLIASGIVGVYLYFLFASIVGRSLSGTRKWEV